VQINQQTDKRTKVTIKNGKSPGYFCLLIAHTQVISRLLPLLNFFSEAPVISRSIRIPFVVADDPGCYELLYPLKEV
jgi:hypothetical protein